MTERGYTRWQTILSLNKKEEADPGFIRRAIDTVIAERTAHQAGVKTNAEVTPPSGHGTMEPAHYAPQSSAARGLFEIGQARREKRITRKGK